LLAYLSFAEKPINLLPIETEILLQILTEVVVNIGAMVCTVKAKSLPDCLNRICSK